jgi:hypothetical protein
MVKMRGMDFMQNLREKGSSLLQLLPTRKNESVVDNYFGRPILRSQEGNDLLRRLVESPEPLMVARIGLVELNCLVNFLRRKDNRSIPYRARTKKEMSNNAGFFPATEEMLDRFCEEFLGHLGDVDVMGVWFNKGEDYICHSFCENAQLVRLRSLEPFYHERPWSGALRDKKVLVIHPFRNTIVSQFAENRERLFTDPEVLPPFRLETIRAVQTIAGAKSPFASWFEAYDSMCAEMEKRDFDVAIIGAGAYGLPLASHAKRLGKKAIHLGGATQILFGIKGKRWDEHEVIAKLYNEYWVRPGGDEIPDRHKVVEGGCYW